MVIEKLPADLGIPERTPVVSSKVIPAGRAEVLEKDEEASVVMVWLSATPAMATTAALEVKAGPVVVWTVTVKLPVAVIPVRVLDALNPRVKVPVTPDPGAIVINPVAELREAHVGREVTVNKFAPLLLRI